MGSIVKDGESYTHNGFKVPASDVEFLPGLSGLKSKNINDAVLELYTILKNSVQQFAYRNYEYTAANDQTVMEFLKEVLVTSSRAVGGFHLFYLTISADKHYIGLTKTTDTKCSFDLHSIENPEILYYGFFDNMSTGNPDSFSMFAVSNDGVELFTKPDFEI